MTDPPVISALRADGTVDPAHDPGLSDPECLLLYEKMVLLRALDEKGIALQRAGRIGFYVPSAGQEACPVGAAYGLREGDWIFPSYRDHGMALVLGCPLSTLVGGVPGGLPPMIGWAAATNTLSIEAWVLFAIVFLWQMPHFLAIAWLCREDYARAAEITAAWSVASVPSSTTPANATSAQRNSRVRRSRITRNSCGLTRPTE